MTATASGIDDELAEALFAHHAANPDVSVQEYVNGLKAQAEESIAGRRKLYLDTRYWIHLRDAEMGQPLRPERSEILARIRSLVTKGLAIQAQ